jgi:molybdenum cofactor cytidylyltransferase
MIAAVVLAAGLSQRMGRPKLNLSWGETTVIGRVIEVLQGAGIQRMVVVTGGNRREVEAALQEYAVQIVYNPAHQTGEMLSSLQAGLMSLEAGITAALVCLGDQPQIERKVVRGLVRLYHQKRGGLLVPSYQNRRGHPWILGRDYFADVLALQEGQTLRDFLNAHQTEIAYLEVDTPSVLADLDTPQDYAQLRPD